MASVSASALVFRPLLVSVSARIFIHVSVRPKLTCIGISKNIQYWCQSHLQPCIGIGKNLQIRIFNRKTEITLHRYQHELLGWYMQNTYLSTKAIFVETTVKTYFQLFICQMSVCPHPAFMMGQQNQGGLLYLGSDGLYPIS